MAKNRNEIPEKLTWDLTTIYKTDKEWEAELTRIKSELSLVEETDPGHLLDSAESLLIITEKKCYPFLNKLKNYMFMLQ